MDKIETDCIWVILKKSPQRFSSLWQIAWIKAVFAQNHIFDDVEIILSVKDSTFPFSSFKLVINLRFS